MRPGNVLGTYGSLEADMEDWIDVHGCGKIESERRSANWANYSEGTERRTSRLEEGRIVLMLHRRGHT